MEEIQIKPQATRTVISHNTMDSKRQFDTISRPYVHAGISKHNHMVNREGNHVITHN